MSKKLYRGRKVAKLELLNKGKIQDKYKVSDESIN